MVLPNRVATYFGILTGIVGAVIPVVVDMDTTTTAGWIAGIGAVVTAVSVWLVGWQKHEARTAVANTSLTDDPVFPVTPDVGQTPDAAPGSGA